MPDPAWRQYQEQVASFFRELGLSAEVDVSLKGVRTTHDIDVVVESMHKGISIRWLVECKYWSSPVTKLHVLALREIVSEVGADRGFVMCESGYQKGAREAAFLSNIQLSSLEELGEICSSELAMLRVRKLFVRAQELGDRYWRLSKQVRIDHDLRPDFMLGGYSGDSVVKAVKAVAMASFFHGFPVIYNELEATTESYGGRRQPGDIALGTDIAFDEPAPLADFMADQLDELEKRLRAAEVDVGG